MTLPPGTRLGFYEIVGQIGEGAMGQVYRARDTKLNRDVALKILPDSFATDPDRLTRFTREAQTLASLNHPNIAHIHGLEESGNVRALVMELVEGDDLSQRIARGAIPLDEALSIARQIAEALECSHEQGIIHRDLKPANVKVRADGTVKVLDFGLAKTHEPADATLSGSMSPTITTPLITQEGVILGTVAYMSPEQARGKAVDRRADIWAFGIILFEMLTGDRPFHGESAADTIGSVLKTDPNWSTLPATVPPGLRRLLRWCLDKDPRRRMRDIGDARLQVEDLLRDGAEAAAAVEMSSSLRLRQDILPWAVGASVMVGGLLLILWAPWRMVSPAASASVRLRADLGAGVSVTNTVSGPAMTLSSDGAMIAFVAQSGTGGTPQMFVRRLNQLQSTSLSGTEGAASPFFSPDDQWIGFFADGKLKKISVAGGAVVTLCDAPTARGGTWAEDGTIIFSPTSERDSPLARVSSNGGRPAPLTSVADGEVSQRWPQLLPGGKAVLFTSGTTVSDYSGANLVVQRLPNGARNAVQSGAYYGRYLPSGHLVYIRDGTLFAVPFDLDRLEIVGQPLPAVEGVTSNLQTGSAQFAVSASGTLAYLAGQVTSEGLAINWTGRDGRTMQMRTTRSNWFNLVLAPDNHRLALEISDDIWVYDWTPDTLTRLTFDPASDRKPVWSPNGRYIAFQSSRGAGSTPNLYWQRSDGTGDVQRLTDSKNVQQPASWHPSGKFLAFEEVNPETQNDVMILPMDGDDAAGWKPGRPSVFLNSTSQEREPMFSPDGRWIAYFSNETGRAEVYVRPFPGPGGKWQISVGGGILPTWSRSRHEIVYGTFEGEIMVASYSVDGDSFHAEKPRPWSDVRYVTRGLNRMFDLHPDGDRLALARAAGTPATPQDHITFVFNFFDDLRRITSPTKR